MAGNHHVTFREMRPDETGVIRRAARKCFSAVEGAAISRPKLAILAEVNGALAGGATLKVIDGSKGKIGYVDIAFVLPEFRGHGLGNRLYTEAVRALRRRGCGVLCAVVEGDNAGSERAFDNAGFSRAGLPQALGAMGSIGLIKLYTGTAFAVATGMQLWMTGQPSRRVSAAQLFWFFVINAALMLLWLTPLAGLTPVALGAGTSLLAAAVLGGSIGMRVSGRPHAFRLAQGGALLSTGLAILGGFFPIWGRWYAEGDRQAVRRASGLSAAAQWACVLALTVAAVALRKMGLYWQYTAVLGAYFLMFHAIPVYPFAPFGGKRVLDMNRTLYAVLAALSLGTVVWAMFL